MQAASEGINPAESLGSMTSDPVPPMQEDASLHKNFGQPVVRDEQPVLDEATHTGLLTPAKAAVRFHVPEYLLRKGCSEGRLAHVRVVNALWLVPAAVAAFAQSWRTHKKDI